MRHSFLVAAAFAACCLSALPTDARTPRVAAPATGTPAGASKVAVSR